MYSGKAPPFQIDANFGFGGAVLAMLVVDLPVAFEGGEEVRTVVLGPAIPSAWGGGSVSGLRLRGGSVVDFSWDADGVVDKAEVVVEGLPVKLVNVKGQTLSPVTLRGGRSVLGGNRGPLLEMKREIK
jgi:alpha-L-fucosidase 2